MNSPRHVFFGESRGAPVPVILSEAKDLLSRPSTFPEQIPRRFRSSG